MEGVPRIGEQLGAVARLDKQHSMFALLLSNGGHACHLSDDVQNRSLGTHRGGRGTSAARGLNWGGLGIHEGFTSSE